MTAFNRHNSPEQQRLVRLTAAVRKAPAATRRAACTLIDSATGDAPAIADYRREALTRHGGTPDHFTIARALLACPLEAADVATRQLIDSSN